MSCAAQADLCICQGATLQQTFRWLSDDVAVDLTGYSAQFQMRATEDSATAALTLTSAGGGISMGGVSGTFTLSASAASTSAITAGRYVYAIELTSPASVIRRIVEGVAKVSREVVR
jgi:hypothetical protein